MPYIKQEDRPELDKLIDQFPKLDVGQLNYVFTRLAHSYIKAYGLRYHFLNAVVGVFDCAKAEFIRRIVSPYEDDKIAENGVCSALEAHLHPESDYSQER